MIGFGHKKLVYASLGTLHAMTYDVFLCTAKGNSMINNKSVFGSTNSVAG